MRDGLATWAAPSGAGWVLARVDLTNTNSGRVSVAFYYPGRKAHHWHTRTDLDRLWLTTDAGSGSGDPAATPGSDTCVLQERAGYSGFDYAANTTAFTLINPNGGNVGIGTNTPTSRLRWQAPAV
ncbi:MAG: hypothetical protein R2818_06915 [Flavobacteriales bacterium]